MVFNFFFRQRRFAMPASRLLWKTGQVIWKAISSARVLEAVLDCEGATQLRDSLT